LRKNLSHRKGFKACKFYKTLINSGSARIKKATYALNQEEVYVLKLHDHPLGEAVADKNRVRGEKHFIITSIAQYESSAL
jgi:hypothetical protein